MFFSKKPNVIPKISAPPPWENIDTVPKKTFVQKFSLVVFTARVTGFSMMASRVLLLTFSAALVFIAYALYGNFQKPFPQPPHVERPAIDVTASSTQQ